MTEMDKMMAFHAMQEIKEVPSWMQDKILVDLCKFDKSGRFEKIARVLAEHKMPTNEIVPCVMDIMQYLLVEMETEPKLEGE